MKTFGSILLILVLCISLCSCGQNNSNANCAHSYYLSDYVDATNSTNGYKVFTCSNCKNSYQEILPAKSGNSSANANDSEDTDLTRKRSVNLFDLPVYSEHMGDVVSLSYCSERTDVDGWKHTGCYEICGNTQEEWVRYELNGKYSTIVGELFDANASGGAGWLEFYDGEDFVAATPKIDESTSSVEFEIDITGVEFLTVHFCATEAGTWMIADDVILTE